MGFRVRLSSLQKTAGLLEKTRIYGENIAVSRGPAWLSGGVGRWSEILKDHRFKVGISILG